MKNILTILCVVNFIYASNLLMYFDTYRDAIPPPPNPFNTDTNSTLETNDCQNPIAIFNNKVISKSGIFTINDYMCESKIIKISNNIISLENGEKLYVKSNIQNIQKEEINTTQKHIFDNIRDYNLIK